MFFFALADEGAKKAQTGVRSDQLPAARRSPLANQMRLILGGHERGSSRVSADFERYMRGLSSTPMTRGFVYLAVVLDWFSRRVLAWRVSITIEAAFCVS